MSHPLSMGRAGRRGVSGFTLTELLVVIAIMGVLVSISIPALNSLKGAGDFNKLTNDLVDTISFARTYAMENNTYVYLGIAEVDRSQLVTATPQTPGIGRIAVAIAASKDGTSQFAGGATTQWDYSAVRTNLSLINKVQVFDQVHMPARIFNVPAQGGMVRPTSTNNQTVALFTTASGSTTPFSYNSFGVPLAAGALGDAQYQFSQVIAFSPQGAPSGNGQAQQWIELDFQPCHGNTDPGTADVTKGNVAAILIDGATGAPRLYRP